jgi:LysR substrate binding domain
MSGSRSGHGSSAISSRKARASGDQAARVNAHSSRARGGSRLRTEARRGPTTIFEGTSAGPSPAAASAATPAIYLDGPVLSGVDAVRRFRDRATCACSSRWEEFVVILPPGDPLREGERPVALAALAEREWVLFEREHALAELTDRLCAAEGFTPRAAVRSALYLSNTKSDRARAAARRLFTAGASPIRGHPIGERVAAHVSATNHANPGAKARSARDARGAAPRGA